MGHLDTPINYLTPNVTSIWPDVAQVLSGELRILQIRKPLSPYLVGWGAAWRDFEYATSSYGEHNLAYQEYLGVYGLKRGFWEKGVFGMYRWLLMYNAQCMHR